MTKNTAPIYDREMEEALIGAALISPSSVSLDAEDVRPEHFYLEPHRWLWQSILDADGKADIATVSDRLGAARLKTIGGPGHLVGLMNACPSVVHMPEYAEAVMRDARRRRQVEIASEVARAAHAGDDPEAVERLAVELQGLGHSRAVFADTYAAADRWYTQAEAWVKTRSIPGLSTGFPVLDARTHGLKRGEETIIAAVTSMGKSSFVAQIIDRQTKAGLRVFCCLLEMTAANFLGRMVLARHNLDYRRLNGAHLATLSKELNELSDRPNLLMSDAGNLSASQIASLARKAALQFGGLDAIYIDHMGHVNHNADKSSPAWAVGRSNKVFTALAKELDAALVLVCQLNRSTPGELPTLARLRDSGELEQDARQVWMIHRDQYGTMFDPTVPQDVRILVLKNDNGPTGHHEMKFIPASAQYAEITNQQGG